MIARLADDRRQRQAGGEALGHHHQIGLDPRVLIAEHPAGSSEAALHLVGDEHDAVPLGDAREAAA